MLNLSPVLQAPVTVPGCQGGPCRVPRREILEISSCGFRPGAVTSRPEFRVLVGCIEAKKDFGNCG